MKHKIIPMILLSLVFIGTPAMATDSEKEAAALVAAEKWVALIDDGNYAESWRAAATFFRQSVPAEQWEQLIKSARKPLGKTLSRKSRVTTYTTSPPGAPDGEYVIILFDTSFQNKKTAVETITPMIDKDGNWRVSGYYIR